jgi:predicted TIM-barrel fold metal-dependent hydrolase
MGSHSIVDADAHYFEPIGELGQYLEEPWRSRLDDENDSSSILPSSTGSRFMAGRIEREDISYPEEPMKPAEVPIVMEKVGVDKIILLPNRMLSFGGISGRERAVNIANGYTDLLLDQVVDPAEGIYALVVVPYHDVDASVDLIERVKDEEGIVGVGMITAGPEPPLGDSQYDPIYAAAEHADLPMVFHTGGSGLDEFYIRGYEKFIETHTLGFLWNNMAQMVSIIVQGVPEKFPDLEIVFQEAGLSWVPMMMHRLDAEYLKRRSEAPLLEQRPSKYMQEMYYGTQPLEQPEDPSQLAHIIETIGGVDRLIYSSDYPHWDYDPPSVITDIPFLSEAEKGNVLGGTAERVFEI